MYEDVLHELMSDRSETARLEKRDIKAAGGTATEDKEEGDASPLKKKRATSEIEPPSPPPAPPKKGDVGELEHTRKHKAPCYLTTNPYPNPVTLQ